MAPLCRADATAQPPDAACLNGSRVHTPLCCSAAANALARLTPACGPHHHAPGRSRAARDSHARRVTVPAPALSSPAPLLPAAVRAHKPEVLAGTGLDGIVLERAGLCYGLTSAQCRGVCGCAVGDVGASVERGDRLVSVVRCDVCVCLCVCVCVCVCVLCVCVVV